MKVKSWYRRRMPAIQFMMTVMRTMKMDRYGLSPSIYIYRVSHSLPNRHFFNNFTTNEDIATKFEANLRHCVRNLRTS